MSIDQNKIDFETALEKMQNVIEALDSCIDGDIMNTLTDVINEYDTHFKPDIEEMIDDNESMKDKLCI